MTKTLFLQLISLLLCYNFANAQAFIRSAIPEANIHFGTIIAHSKKITIQTGHAVGGAEVGLRWQTTGRQPWHAQRRFPAYGITAAWFQLGENAHHQAFGLFPYLFIPITRANKLKTSFRIGAGISYVTHPYHLVSNPDQNAIGSYLNNMTQVRFQWQYPLAKQWLLTSALCLTHISNGSLKLPNYGINIPSLSLGAAWQRHVTHRAPIAPVNDSAQRQPRFGALIYVGYSRYNYYLVGGPSYPVSSAAVAATYRFSPNNRLSLGAEYEFNRAIYEWGKKTTTFKTDAEATRGATRLAITAGNEFRFGNLGIHLHFGYYVGDGFNRNIRDKVYNKYTIRYHLPTLFGSQIRPHIACSLKAHKSVAEHFGVQVGFSW